ncbi:DUF4397 domain-containing protein [Chitinophaga sp. Mgbs1]|uniref:DUF4397 domain-containing protein n=1 Tax=Chitinophaga solisilvae TaxID=1233460 RepID=A0A9Q5GV30_9BACT|nr:DUF4397 domain-containing protein [Chitinophaga solisilvae]
MYCSLQHRLLSLLYILMLAFTAACTKPKIAAGIPEDNLLTISSSNIRLFNVSQRTLNVTVNNTVLAMQRTSPLEEPGISVIGKQLFPDGMWKNGTSFSIPSLVLDQSGDARLSAGDPGTGITFRDTVLRNDPARPVDVYLLPAGKMVCFPRNNTPPADPQHFKIRIVNLGATQDDFNTAGPVSLTYADGTAVDPVLNNIAAGTSSPYAEIPYGAYQFKLFAGGDYSRQLVTGDMQPAFNSCKPGRLPQAGFMPPVVTFKPGGVYTIMVVNRMFLFSSVCGGTSFNESKYANAYQLITDLDAGVNLTYARVHAVNAIPGKNITVRVDGRPLGEGPLGYIGDIFREKAIAADYHTIVQGSHTAEALDEKGNTLAAVSMQLFSYDNYTIWAYREKGGSVKLLFTSNDMTHTIYRTGGNTNIQGPDDGTDGERRRLRFTYAWQSRFLNLCNEQPEITFTNNGQLFLPEFVYPDTLRFASAYRHLRPGILPERNPAVIYRLNNISKYTEEGRPDTFGSNDDLLYFPEKIWVNNTAGGQSPGTLLTTVTPLTCRKTFIANNSMYAATITTPPAENGIYTLALVGGEAGAAPRIIAIKHNK